MQKLLEKFDNAKIQKISVKNLKYEKGITEGFRSEMGNCIRIYPYLNDTDGFFIAKIRKDI